MSLRSVITVDVDDSAFKAFQRDYQQFQNNSRMQITPGVPATTGGRNYAPGPGSGGHGGSGDIGAAVTLLEDIRELIEKIVHRMQTQGGGGGGDGGSPDKGTGGIPSIAKGMFGRLAMGGLMVTAAGALAYEGISSLKRTLDDHAEDATNMRRSAREANTSIGAYKAFQTAFSPYGDADQLLNTVAQSQSDVRNPGYFGLQAAGAGRGDSSDVAAEHVIRALRQAGLETRNNPGMLGMTLDQRFLTPFDPSGTMSRSLASVSDKEFNQMLDRINRDSKRFNVQDGTAKVWQDLNTTVSESRAAMNTAFLQDLPFAAKTETAAVEKLTGVLENASGRIQKAFPGLTGNQTSDMQNLFALPSGIGKPSSPSVNPLQWLKYKMWMAGADDGRKVPGDLKQFAWKNIAMPLGQTEDPSMNRDTVSKAGAIGIWQVEPSLAKAYGYSAQNMHSPLKNAAVSSQYWNAMLAKYKDPYKTLAAYNEGETRLDKQVKKYGDKWLEGIKSEGNMETYNYVTKSKASQAITELFSGGKPNVQDFHIKVENSTQNKVNVSARNSVRTPGR